MRITEPNELILAINELIDGGYDKSKKSRMIQLYRSAFPLDTTTDFNCPGCVLKCWGKLQLFAKENRNFSPLNTNIMADKAPDCNYKLKIKIEKGQSVSYPKARVFNLTEDTLTDAIALRLIKAGYGDVVAEIKPKKPTGEQ